MKNLLSLITASLAGILFLASCGGEKKENQGQPGPQAYKVLQVEQRPTSLYNDFPASIQGEQNIEIRPKVDGFIKKIFVDEGQAVKKGQLLFTIDAPQYEQDVRNAAAAVSSAEAAVNTAQLQVNKTIPLVKKEIISNFELESAQNSLKSYTAALAQSRATLANAKTNLGYTRIVSPVNGVVGALPYKLGSLVSSTTTEPLTTISNIGKVYAYFSINEKTQLTFLREAQGKTFAEKLKNLPEVSLILSDGSEYEPKGIIETVSGQVDTQTGSFNVRATFQNPQGLLRSGNSASVRIPSRTTSALLIPQSATYEIQGKLFAYVVGDSSAVKSVELKVQATPSGQAYVVQSGLKAKDIIVIEGITGLAEGTKIKPVFVNADSLKTLK
ncbi:efflux RND transporter periplasmic adaptor subunit [Dyadobacter sp. CY356]|uniref:efflux RND transporter periplasmic adaptor subunit n=1 Tax=Dyadobacter sp. CY356 TaxID=2906442 RepID=UPI001F263640|nr:efflux RND transporter periplasmic adaptor subunit [Dyadobacter sp. CY356]MCF0054945.1 efflux RND transporter periplasmic adaptor subunit [Dyadobacter sp. CY356]